MRKLCKMLFLCALLVVAVLQFTGCGNGEINWQKMDLESMESEKRAEILEKAAEQEMNKLDSYTRRLELEFGLTVGSVCTKAYSTMQLQEANRNSDNYQYKEISTNKIVVGDTRHTTTTLEGFQDGEMYRKHEEGLNKIMLRSDVSKEDFIANLQANSDSIDSILERDGFTYTRQSEKAEDGWLIKISGCSDNFIRTLEREMNLITLYPDGFLEDVEVDVYVTAQMLFRKIEVRFITKEDVDFSTYKFEVAKFRLYYEKLNETEVRDEDISEYEVVTNLRVLDVIENGLGTIKNSENGRLTLFLSQTVSGAKELELKENSVISYKLEDGKINYTCESTVNDEKILLTFEDGVKKKFAISDDGEQKLKDRERVTNGSQIAFIESLIEIFPFDKDRIKSFTETDVPGQYKFEYIEDEDLTNQYKENGYAVTDESTYYIYVTIEDGRVVAYEVDFQIIYRNSWSKYTVDIESEAVFEEY